MRTKYLDVSGKEIMIKS